MLLMRGGLNRPTNPAASATPPQIKGRSWMYHLQVSCAYSLHYRGQQQADDCSSSKTKQNAKRNCCIQGNMSVELSSKWQKGYLGKAKFKKGFRISPTVGPVLNFLCPAVQYCLVLVYGGLLLFGFLLFLSMCNVMSGLCVMRCFMLYCNYGLCIPRSLARRLIVS